TLDLVLSQILLEPRVLLGSTSPGDEAVERDDVPRADVVAVKARAVGALDALEIAEIAHPRALVLVIAGGRLRAALESAPAWAIAVVEPLRRPVVVGEIADREDRRGGGILSHDLLDELGGVLGMNAALAEIGTV